jgi:hypothetical protein
MGGVAAMAASVELSPRCDALQSVRRGIVTLTSVEWSDAVSEHVVPITQHAESTSPAPNVESTDPYGSTGIGDQTVTATRRVRALAVFVRLMAPENLHEGGRSDRPDSYQDA